MKKTDVTLDGLLDIRVYQRRDGYRFSVDALLLYTFVRMEYADRIVDLGTGSGIIGLLLARRFTKAKVHLIELQDSLFRLAQRNIRLNRLSRRVTAVHADVRDVRLHLEPSSCDLCVSNPPYRCAGSGRLSTGQEKAIARHELMVTLADVVDAASFLLKGKGRFCLIYHPGRLLEAFDLLRSRRLEPKRIRFVHNDRNTESKIVLIESVRDGKAGLKIEKPLYLYDKPGVYTVEVEAMYGRTASDLKG